MTATQQEDIITEWRRNLAFSVELIIGPKVTVLDEIKKTWKSGQDWDNKLIIDCDGVLL